MSVSELQLPREFAGAHSFGAIHCVHCTLHLGRIPCSGECDNACLTQTKVWRAGFQVCPLPTTLGAPWAYPSDENRGSARRCAGAKQRSIL